MQATSSASLDELLVVPSEESVVERLDEASAREFATVFEEALANEAVPREHAEELPEELLEEAPDEASEPSPLLANASTAAAPTTVIAQAFAGVVGESQRTPRHENGATDDADRADDTRRTSAPLSQSRPDGPNPSPDDFLERPTAPLDAARSLGTSPLRPTNPDTAPTGVPVQATSEETTSREASAPPIAPPPASEVRAISAPPPPPPSGRPTQPRAVTRPGEPDTEESAPVATDRRIAAPVTPTERTGEAQAGFERPVRDESAPIPHLPLSEHFTNGDVAASTPSTPPIVPVAGAAVGLNAAQATLPAPPPGAPQPVEALSQHVEMLASQGGGTARIRLHPERLGEVDITVSMRGNNVEIVIRAEEPAAQAAVLAHREQLVDSLGARELRMESFDVRGGGRGLEANGGRAFHEPGGKSDARDDRNPQGRDGVPSDFAASAARRAPVTFNPVARAGIDLRI